MEKRKEQKNDTHTHQESPRDSATTSSTHRFNNNNNKNNKSTSPLPRLDCGHSAPPPPLSQTKRMSITTGVARRLSPGVPFVLLRTRRQVTCHHPVSNCTCSSHTSQSRQRNQRTTQRPLRRIESASHSFSSLFQLTSSLLPLSNNQTHSVLTHHYFSPSFFPFVHPSHPFSFLSSFLS